MNTIRLATVLFDTKIASAEIPYFRGSVIRLSEGNALFHNHCAEGFHYAYPLVQYKRIKGCAALMGINQGAEALAELFGGRPSLSFSLGNRQTVMNVAVIRSEKFAVVCDEVSRAYAISRWLPLNGTNYRIYQQTESLAERISMLEKILVGNILSFAKGVGIFFERPVICRVQQLEASGLVDYKGVELMSFSARFSCNVSLPEDIGLGKSASMSNGIVKRL